MTEEPVWILKSVALKIHDAQLAEHGGSSGLRDDGLLESACIIHTAYLLTTTLPYSI